MIACVRVPKSWGHAEVVISRVCVIFSLRVAFYVFCSILFKTVFLNIVRVRLKLNVSTIVIETIAICNYINM